MICPNCNVVKLEIKNNNYYCPNCKIYIGSVINYNPLNPVVIDKPIVDRRGFIKHYVYKITAFLTVMLIILYFTHNLFYIDVTKGCYLAIVPSLHLEFTNAGIKRALTIIKNISPDNYKNICQRVNIIDTNISCGGMEGGCFDSAHPRTIYVTAPAREITWVAEVLVHEACHARQKYEGRPGEERECHEMGLKVMQEATVYSLYEYH